MPDPITMFHPGVPNSTSWVERETYREHWYPRGWRSNDDPYTQVDHLTPGSEIDSAELSADGSTFSSASEISTSARVTLPLLGQPILLEAWFQLASVTSASTFTLAFSKLADVAAPIGWKGARQYVTVPINGTAGVGTPIHLAYRVPANTTGTDWALAGQRDSGTGTGQLKANAIYGAHVVARAL